jgi:hypothetical protein
LKIDELDKAKWTQMATLRYTRSHLNFTRDTATNTNAQRSESMGDKKNLRRSKQIAGAQWALPIEKASEVIGSCRSKVQII